MTLGDNMLYGALSCKILEIDGVARKDRWGYRRRGRGCRKHNFGTRGRKVLATFEPYDVRERNGNPSPERASSTSKRDARDTPRTR